MTYFCSTSDNVPVTQAERVLWIQSDFGTMFAFNNSISQNTAQPHAFLLEGKLQSFMIPPLLPPGYPRLKK